MEPTNSISPFQDIENKNRYDETNQLAKYRLRRTLWNQFILRSFFFVVDNIVPENDVPYTTTYTITASNK